MGVASGNDVVIHGSCPRHSFVVLVHCCVQVDAEKVTSIDGANPLVASDTKYCSTRLPPA